MIWSLIKLDLRKALPKHLIIVAALTGFILITHDILDSANVFVSVLAMAQGWMLAYLIFRDPHNTQAFVFSRPWSPARIFWNRWALGMTLQALTLLLIYTILASGTRTWLYQRTLPYFPMVERFELSILWPIGLGSAIAFHIIMFLMFQRRVMNSGTGWWQSTVIKIALCLILMTCLGDGGLLVITKSGGGIRIGQLVILYAAVLVVLCTGASVNCIKNMEIGS